MKTAATPTHKIHTGVYKMFGTKDKQSADLPKLCCYCEKAALISDDENVLCSLKGIVNCEYSCKKFSYDPLKRKPKTLPPLPVLDDLDMTI